MQSKPSRTTKQSTARAFVAALFLTLICAETALSADIVVHPDVVARAVPRLLGRAVEAGFCEINLSGAIDEGDVARLAKAIAEVRRLKAGLGRSDRIYDAALDPYRIHVCLNSPGGNFNEGVDLAKLLSREFVGTVVTDVAQCFSACALAFMGGASNLHRNSSGRYERHLHVNGRLGFHTPYIPDTPATASHR